MITLRHYQHDCVESVFKEWENVRSTLAVLPTGTGKSLIFSEVVRRVHPRRALVIAHTRELINQAVRHVERAGLKTEIEMGDSKADASLFNNASVIVATIQTLNAGVTSKRIEKFRPQDFGVLVIDEGHRGVCASYKKVMQHFLQNPDLRIFSCTASPDRLDKKALGQVFDSVAFEYEIVDAINDGWLVPIEQQFVSVGTLDYSHVKTTAGELNGADLTRVMEDEKNLQGMVGPSIEIVGQKKFIAFTCTVRHAEMCSDIFNRHRSGMTAWISGKTPHHERDKIIRDYQSGAIQGLINVGVCVEGFDAPETEVIIMGKPTLSRARYCQMAGRGTRPIGGVLDGLHSSYERKEAIAESKKPSCLLLDFVGNSGKHKLMSSVDILGGKYTDEEKKLAVEMVTKSAKPIRMSEALKQMRLRIEQQKAAEAARKARLIAKVHYSSKPVSPFDAFDIKPRQDSKWDTGKPLSEKQRAVLQKMGVNPDELNYAAAKQLLLESFKRREKGLCSLKQAQLLKKHGYEPKKMTFQEASKIIDELKNHGWKRTDLILT